MIASLIISLSLTLVIELTTSLILGIRSKQDIKIVICVNVCTNPVVVYIANCISLLNNDVVYNIVVIIMEITVVFIEAAFYKKYLTYKGKSSLLISSVNNIVSFSLGVIINILF